MRNLLAAFRPESFAVIAEAASSFEGEHNAAVPSGLDVLRIGVPRFVRRIPYGARISRCLRFGLIPFIERMICRKCKELTAKSIIAVYPSWPFLIAAYRAHLRSGLPLSTYHMDVSPTASELGSPDRAMAGRYELDILRAATARLVLSEAIAEDFQQRFSLSSEVIPHSIDLARLPANVVELPQLDRWKGHRLVVHTGVVEGLQREGLQRLKQVIEGHPELNAALVLSTPTSRESLLATGFDSPCVQILSLQADEVFSLQRLASVLVAVLPFKESIESYRRTSFPSKVVEYLASGTPILAHAPADCFFAKHVRKGGYAWLVDRPDGNSLLEGLTMLLTDADTRLRLVQAARRVVENEFDLRRIAVRFANACQIDEITLKEGFRG
jgi:glycosyltransferase involved in cell wall biosynthesis